MRSVARKEFNINILFESSIDKNEIGELVGLIPKPGFVDGILTSAPSLPWDDEIKTSVTISRKDFDWRLHLIEYKWVRVNEAVPVRHLGFLDDYSHFATTDQEIRDGKWYEFDDKGWIEDYGSNTGLTSPTPKYEYTSDKERDEVYGSIGGSVIYD